MRDLIGKYESSISKLKLKNRSLHLNTLIIGESNSGKTNLACHIRNYVIDNSVPTIYLDFDNSALEDVELRYKDEHFNYLQFDESDAFQEQLDALIAARKHIYLAADPRYFASSRDIKSKLTQTFQKKELLENYYYFFHDIANLNGFYAKFEDFLLYMLGFLNMKKYGFTFISQPNSMFENPQVKLLFSFLYLGRCSNVNYYNTAALKSLTKNTFVYQHRQDNKTLLFSDIKSDVVKIDEYKIEE